MTALSEVAAEYLKADLEPRSVGLLRTLWEVTLSAITGSDNSSSAYAYDLVVTRLQGGAEVIRTRADVDDPQFLLERVQLDLEKKTVHEFIREWHPEPRSASASDR